MARPTAPRRSGSTARADRSGGRPGPVAAPVRRRFAVIGVILAAAVLAGISLFFVRGRDADNGAVVVISIDTLRADRLGIYGYAKARNSVSFT